MKTARLALLMLSFVLVAACGTKGDLVLPETPAAPPAADAPAAPDASAAPDTAEPPPAS
jgi:predicted small lipoprotein YifL